MPAGQPKVLEQIQSSDELYICAYPHFNVGEIIAIAELYEGAAKDMGTPIVVFNGEYHGLLNSHVVVENPSRAC